jgi:hypothetical protein
MIGLCRGPAPTRTIMIKPPTGIAGGPEKWRYIDSYRVYVTTSRIALQGSREWHDVWYVNLRTLEYDHQGITFQTSGNPRSRLRMFPTDYWFVMLRKLAYNEIYDIPTPC